MIALIAWRGGATAKSRLATLLSAEQRCAMVDHLLARVVSAVRGSGMISRMHIVSPTLPPQCAEGWIPDEGWGLNTAFSHALTTLPREPVLLLPADLPFLSESAIDRFIAAVPPDGAGIVTDSRGTGTNALLLPDPQAIQPAFGSDSAARHRLLVEAAGLPLIIWKSPEFDDLDTPDDWHRYRMMLKEVAHAA